MFTACRISNAFKLGKDDEFRRGKNGARDWLRQVVWMNLYVVFEMMNMRNQIILATINAIELLKY